jgi:hypothetical protein
MDQDLLADAFDVANKAYSPATSREALARLRERVPHATTDDISKAFDAARYLDSCAYDVADKHRDGIHSKVEALALLRECCPGFSEDTYQHAFAQGLFSSR